MSELKSCPFCDVTIPACLTHVGYFFHPHNKCVLAGKKLKSRLWNERTPDPRLREMVREITNRMWALSDFDIEKADMFRRGRFSGTLQTLCTIYERLPELKEINHTKPRQEGEKNE